MTLQAIKYTRGSLQILDQLALPHTQSYDAVRSAEDAWHAIRSMKVRGAPAIAIVAALSVAVELANAPDAYRNLLTADDIVGRLDYLVTSRPTAVNLADAARKLGALVHSSIVAEGQSSVAEVYIAAAEEMLISDVADNRAIGAAGAKWILDRADKAGYSKVSVLTHCNTGSLATAGYGTALGIVRALHASGRLERAYYGETRPYNQGARLTGFELLSEGIPATLVTDSMAGALMAQRGPKSGHAATSTPTQAAGAPLGDAPLVAVIVGADRVAANGDTANKIGTYSLAVLAQYHGVDFIVAAPRTTVDLKTASGREIVIEQRAQREVTVIKGPVVLEGEKLDLADVREVSGAPVGTTAWNPAFDVTPGELIEAVVTEVGVVERDGKRGFKMEKVFNVGKGEKESLAGRKPETMPDPVEGP